jgi:hypothetical protein
MTGLILHRWQEEDKKRLRQRLIISMDTEASSFLSPLAYGICIDTNRSWFDTSSWQQLPIAGVFTPYRNGSIHCACTSLLGGRDCFVKLRG